jgi:hypothetical protein
MFFPRKKIEDSVLWETHGKSVFLFLFTYPLLLRRLIPVPILSASPFLWHGGDGDGSSGAGGGCGRGGDVPVGSVRLHAARIHGGGDVVPEGAGCSLRAPRHRLSRLRPPLRLQPPLRRSRRRQLQPHRRRRILRRRPHQPVPLLRRAPLPGPGTHLVKSLKFSCS